MERPIATLDQGVATIAKLLRVLREAGLTDEALRQPINDRAMRARLVQFWNARGFYPSTSQKRAKEIMGTSYLGPEDVMIHFGVSFTDNELVQLREIPFSEAELEACKDTHVLFPGYSLSILDIRNKVEHLFYNQDWYEKEAFAKKEKVNLQWYLIRRQEVHNSTSKNWQEQQALLNVGTFGSKGLNVTSTEVTPRACEVIFMVMLYFLATGKRLLERMYVRCIDVSSRGRRVGVGCFDSGGIGVYDWTGDGRDDFIGLAASRKLPSLAL